MTLLCCLLILTFATMVVTAPVRGKPVSQTQGEKELSFIIDALGTATEKTTPANITGYRNPPSKPVRKEDSEDLSDAESTEAFVNNRFTDQAEDRDSLEIMMPTIVEKDKALSLKKTGADKEHVGLMDTSRGLAQDHGSRGQTGPHRPHQDSGEFSDFYSEEEMATFAHEGNNLSGKQVTNLRGDKITGNVSQGGILQRKAGRVDVLNGMMVQGASRELLDWDSLEDNKGRPVPLGNRRDTDYDETREYTSSEMYPLAPPEHMPSSLSVPAKSGAS